jgi:hypothetical protein
MVWAREDVRSSRLARLDLSRLGTAFLNHPSLREVYSNESAHEKLHELAGRAGVKPFPGPGSAHT